MCIDTLIYLKFGIKEAEEDGITALNKLKQISKD